MRSALVALALASLVVSPAIAQTDQRLPVVVLDARAFMNALKSDEITARDLEVFQGELPTRGLGAVAGVHLFPVRRQTMALGLGGEVMFARGSKAQVDEAGVPTGAGLDRKLQSLCGVLSINFGRRNGWSYLAAGMGPLLYQTYPTGSTPTDAPRKSTISMGGGARWFFSRRLAFGFDLRFYLTRPEAQIGTSPGRERQRLMVLSAGISVR